MLWDKTGDMRLVLVDEGGMQPIFVQDEQKSAVTKTQMEIKRKKDENPKRKEERENKRKFWKFFQDSIAPWSTEQVR
jgi:hypothetical protein